jgi:phage gp46-like protein
MAEDIRINWDIDLMEGDFNLAEGKGDLLRENGLQTAVLISLFTDRRADTNDVIDGDDKRGWWGDNIADIDGDRIGSKLWQIERASTTIETLAKCRKFVREALQWMIDDGVIEKMEVDVERQGDIPNEQLAFEVRLYQSDGSRIAMKFASLWDGQFE